MTPDRDALVRALRGEVGNFADALADILIERFDVQPKPQPVESEETRVAKALQQAYDIEMRKHLDHPAARRAAHAWIVQYKAAAVQDALERLVADLDANGWKGGYTIDRIRDFAAREKGASRG